MMEEMILLSLAHVNKSFQQPSKEAARVLEDISITVGVGDRIALMGSSGSGKTTLLRILAGLESLDAGERSIANQVQIFMTFHEHRLLLKETAIVNIRAVLPFGRTEALGRLKEERIQELLQELFAEYTAIRNQKVESFSEGMKRRVSLARALIAAEYALQQGQRVVLLLDEPFAGLDETTHIKVAEVLSDWLKEHEDTALVYATHDEKDLEYLQSSLITL